jgi:hypothetical protein
MPIGGYGQGQQPEAEATSSGGEGHWQQQTSTAKVIGNVAGEGVVLKGTKG